MRSSRGALAGLAVGVGLGGSGCNLVFGVASETARCGDASFAGAVATRLTAAEAFSVSWDQDRMIYSGDGVLHEQALPGGEPVEIDVLPYVPMALSLAPEGDAMFVTPAIEPPALEAAIRTGAAQWTADAIVPLGTLAGAPSAAEFGPRRVLVRLRIADPEVQEYEADGDRWQPVGDVHAIGGDDAPNLVPSGLDMVYEDTDGSGPAVFIAHRASTAAWFGAAVAILRGAHAFPQLLGRCRTLYALDSADGDPTTAPYVRRYDR